MKHFKEHVCPSACTVLFLTGDHVTGTHRAAIVFPAFAHAYTSQGRPGKIVVVGGILEMGFVTRGIVVFVDPEVGQLTV
jgi:hypothetical protein